MQKNCTEFVAYENLVSRGRPPARGGKAPSGDLAQAIPLVRRALKLLADREVVPQLGLLKSTLLQLDSAFSERDYGASSFRDFVQKLANAGHVTLKGSDRSFHVELREAAEPLPPVTAAPAAASASETVQPAAPAEEPAASPAADPAARGRQADAIHLIQQAFAQARTAPRWPMYARQVKQLVKSVEPQFDERAYGFNGIIDALRFGQREGLFRLERDRLGVVRIFSGPALQARQPGAGEAAGQGLAEAEMPREPVEDALAHPDDVRAEEEAARPEPAEARADESEVRGDPAAHGDATAVDAGSDADAQPAEAAPAADEAPASGAAGGAAKGRRRSRGSAGAQPRTRKPAAARRAAPGNGAPRRARNRKPED